MQRFLAAPLALCLAASLGAQAPATAHSGAFITRLGNDTLTIERFSIANGAYNVEQVLHSPVASLRHTHLGLTPEGAISDVIYMHHDIMSMSAPLLGSTRLTFAAADSAHVTIKEGDSTSTRTIAASATMVPALPDSWLAYEIAARRLLASSADSALMHFLEPDGGRTRVIVRRVGADSVTFGLPFSTYRAHLDGEGRITHLHQPNGLRVERVAAIDINGIAARWDSLDKQGRGMGMLSPLDSVTARVGAADIAIVYSRPSMRGRNIWGALVPWDRVWRTGANDPTVLRTSRDLTIGSTVVSAGSYIVTTLPTAAGTTLILSTPAPGGGRPAEVARLPLATSEVAPPVERFTIAIEPGRGNRATLALSWDRRRMTAPVVVR